MLQPLFLAAGGAILLSGCSAREAYMPRPNGLYDGFAALQVPRADVPVGAVWVDGFGAAGDAAAPDNIETMRSLSGITLNNELRANFTAGLLDFLNLDPSYNRKVSLRLTDLTILRVKDVDLLPGPRGVPRIYPF
ncbi:hypothetical protein [Sphingomonas soli]|uniref:hypothetical protein n=1 Tax=Sphingomonas soli TaxID=266127 RepID=UPI00082D13CD|nr:hypothetical protein [Sphingomonas soli]